MLNILITIFWPIKTLKYFQQYLCFVEALLLSQNIQLIFKLKLFNFITLITAVHFFYLSNPHLTEFERTLHFDGCFVLIPSSHLNTIAGIVAILNLYYLKVLKQGTSFKLVEKLGKLLLYGDVSSFLSSKKENFLFQKNCQKNQKMIKKLSRQYFLMVNIIQSLTLVTSKFFNLKIIKILIFLFQISSFFTGILSLLQKY